MLEVCIIFHLPACLVVQHEGGCMHACFELDGAGGENALLAPVAPLFSAFLLKNSGSKILI